MAEKEKRSKWNFETFKHPRFLGDSWMWWREFLEGKADKTRRNYITALTGFMDYADHTTETLFEQHRDNSRADDPRKKKVVGSKVFQYQKHLIEGGISTGTAYNVAKAVRSFFRSNELDFHANGGIRVVTEEIPNIKKGELKQILDGCGSIRLKAAIHTLKEGGMRVGDLCNIRVKDLADALMGDRDWFTWTFTQIKTKRKADPVLGPEALRWLRFWMKQRDIDGIDSPWLFCLVENHGDGSIVGEKMKPDTMGALFRHYRNKVGLRETGVSIHSLRKYNKTNLEFSGVPTSWINKMQGRVGHGTGGTYTKPNETQLITMYRRGYDELTIEHYTSRDDEMQDMRTELQQLRETVASIADYRDLGLSAEPTPEFLQGLRETQRADADGASTEELEKRVRKLRESQEEA